MDRDIPCRVSADLAILDRKQREDAANTVEFDEYDDNMVKQVASGRLAKPVQALLITLHHIEQTQRSFGVDHRKAFDSLLPDLQALREACRDEWRDL